MYTSSVSASRRDWFSRRDSHKLRLPAAWCILARAEREIKGESGDVFFVSLTRPFRDVYIHVCTQFLLSACLYVCVCVCVSGTSCVRRPFLCARAGGYTVRYWYAPRHVCACIQHIIKSVYRICTAYILYI
eukprot:GEMP01091792.1.p1 GENE.GEMP01091792.1~~GEMP01091792.1.p1  ORF type:complete len:131 (+),score=3.58 GEMP01091792.1:55-447(+)